MSTWAAGEVGKPSILAFIFHEKKAKRKGVVTGFEEADPQFCHLQCTRGQKF